MGIHLLKQSEANNENIFYWTCYSRASKTSEKGWEGCSAENNPSCEHQNYRKIY